MLAGENLRIAFRALWANKMRSILTALGIIIGVAAVIAVVSIVQGLQLQITQTLQGVGATYIVVVANTQNRGPGTVTRQVKLTWEDGQAIRDGVAGVELITPVLVGGGQVKYRERQRQTLILASNEDLPDVLNFQVERGRFFGRFDLEHRRKVVVVGETIVDELRLGSNPIGKVIYVGTVPATIIGVMEHKGQSLGTDVDDIAYFPFETSLSIFGRQAADQVQLRLQAESARVVERVRDDIAVLLRRRHKIPDGEPDDFQILLQDEMLSTVNTILGSVTAVVGAVVGVALLVGGIGIMNIMLVSVTERTREIGVRKSVGARRRDILIQFLIEAVTLSLLGGALGTLLGWGMGAAVAQVLPGDWPPAYVPLWAIALAAGFSSAVGVFFGIYPASKASRLDPIEALRYE